MTNDPRLPDDAELDERLRVYAEAAAPAPDTFFRLRRALLAAAPADTSPAGDIRRAWPAALAAAAVLLTVIGIGYWHWHAGSGAALPATSPLPALVMRCSFQAPNDKCVAVLEVGNDGTMDLFAEGDRIARHRILAVTRQGVQIQDHQNPTDTISIPVTEYPAAPAELVREKIGEFSGHRAAGTLTRTELCLAMLWARQLHPEALDFVRAIADTPGDSLQRSAQLALAGGDLGTMNRLVTSAMQADHPYRREAFARLAELDNLLALDTLRKIAERGDDAFSERAREALAARDSGN